MDMFSRQEGINVALLAPKKWGKTTLILAALTPILKMFQIVFVITKNPDGELASLATDERCILNQISEQFLRKLIDDQKKYSNEDGSRQSLILCFDDYMGDEKDLRYLKALDEVVCNNSHSQINTLFSSHKATRIPHTARQNMDHWFVGGINQSTAKLIQPDILWAGQNPQAYMAKLNLVVREEAHHFAYFRRLPPVYECLMRCPNVKPGRHSGPGRKNKGPPKPDVHQRISELLDDGYEDEYY